MCVCQQVVIELARSLVGLDIADVINALVPVIIRETVVEVFLSIVIHKRDRISDIVSRIQIGMDSKFAAEVAINLFFIGQRIAAGTATVYLQFG